MSDDEKEALKSLQDFKDSKTTYWGYGTWLKVEVTPDKEYCDAIDTVTNLINRLLDKNKELQEVINGKTIQELGVSEFYGKENNNE